MLAFIQKLWIRKLSQQEAVELNELLQNEDTYLRKEWSNSFNTTVIQQQNAAEDDKVSEMFSKLLIKIDKTEARRGKVFLFIKSPMSWAAALIVLAFTGAQIYQMSKKQAPVNAPIASSHISAEPSLKSIANHTKDKMTITLADSSVVVLFSNSTISYRETFDENVRNIRLEGMAYFKVSNDMHKPFIVLSGGFATTVLGTAFSVDTRQAGKVEVKLYEGKVVVGAVHKNLNLIKDVYLRPMQSFRANISTGKFEVSKFGPDKYLSAIKKNKEGCRESVKAELHFDSEPLDKVFDRLNERFHANIRYIKHQLSGLHFTGTVFETDSLKTTITVISNMNGLTFEEQGGYLLIHKKQY